MKPKGMPRKESLKEKEHLYKCYALKSDTLELRIDYYVFFFFKLDYSILSPYLLFSEVG